MIFTWFTYRAASRKAEAEFSAAFGEGYNTGAIFDEDSTLNRKLRTMKGIRARWQRERRNVPLPTRIVRDVFDYILYKRYTHEH